MDEAKPSKSERKREQLELQALGEKLVDLPDDALRELGLEERLCEAIAELRRIKSHGAMRRQKQYIGKLMRDVDPAPLRALFVDRASDEQQARALFKRAERWRDRLLADQGALAGFRAEVASGEVAMPVERLLGELGAARDERTERRLRRELFREIHAALVSASLA